MTNVLRHGDRVHFIVHETKPHPNPPLLGSPDVLVSRIVEGHVIDLKRFMSVGVSVDGNPWVVPFDQILGRASTDPICTQQAQWLMDAHDSPSSTP